MELAKYKACICEGSAEEAIIDILVDNDLLIFNREEMLEERVIRCRSAKRFEERYLRKGFDEQISVIRILDSRREEFRLSKAYEQKIDVVNVITAPEIEMLIIHAEGAYDQFKRSGKKPSEFCKINLRMHDVKSYDFVKQYFSNPQLFRWRAVIGWNCRFPVGNMECWQKETLENLLFRGRDIYHLSVCDGSVKESMKTESNKRLKILVANLVDILMGVIL